MARPQSLAFEDFPDVGTVEEAAAVLRLSRSVAYEEARRYLETGDGLPVLRFGRSLRVPKHRIAKLLGAPQPELATTEAPTPEAVSPSN